MIPEYISKCYAYCSSHIEPIRSNICESCIKSDVCKLHPNLYTMECFHYVEKENKEYLEIKEDKRILRYEFSSPLKKGTFLVSVRSCNCTFTFRLGYKDKDNQSHIVSSERTYPNELRQREKLYEISIGYENDTEICINNLTLYFNKGNYKDSSFIRKE